MTSAAVRALERARKLRAKTILEDSRGKMPAPVEEAEAKTPDRAEVLPLPQPAIEANENGHTEKPHRFVEPEPDATRPRSRKDSRKERQDPFANRKPISEVLHDIYDKNVQ